MISRLRRTFGCLACLTCMSAATTLLAAEPKLNYFFPAGGQRGQTVDVDANGSWDTWPVTAWASRPGIEVAAGEKGKLKITLPADAEPGLVWLRLLNAEGATSPKPFLIGTLPETLEQEPNDDPAKPQTIDKSTVINGRLNKREDVDAYAIHLTKGQTLVASLRANMDLNAPVDTVLQICSSRRFVLAQNDDARGIDPLLVFTAPTDGDYLVRTFGFPATPDSSISFTGGDAMLYRLTLTTSGYVDHALPMATVRGESRDVELVGWNLSEGARRVAVAATDRPTTLAFHPEVANEVPLAVASYPSVVEQAEATREQPQALPVPSSVTGTIEAPKDEDVFRIHAVKGKPLVIDVESDEIGFLLDAVILVLDAEGKVLNETDDAKRARDPQVTFSPPADGDYRVVIRDVHGHGGPRYVYRLKVEESSPTFHLELKADSFRAKAGEKVEIEIAIDRQRGFDGELELTATSLPAGVTATPVKSAPKGDSSKSVKLSLQLAADAQPGPFVVVGKRVGEPPLERAARLPGDLPQPAWITVVK